MIYVSNIQWDTDNDDDVLETLPKELTLSENEVTKNGQLTYKSKEDLLDIVSDYLSDTYGFCHDGFSAEVSG